MKDIQFENKKLYSVVEVGKILGIGKARVYKLIKDGRLSAMNLGGLKIRKEALDNFLDSYESF
ncbi:MAG TPA: helix-turn-helix domain-containing protein [Candidatus Coproplasma excrementigallinarum]|uniref:Helix-turn-helix domain-containing protein n=1 Tax=Candidatus Coproplasma excrementigallinarum TaxID=2840747 RepID=A0A9D1MKQ3_9FIRM|nr:helix-turn-helix domain-containing protein [Candidatus Coproplasma excrementigallinarum]